MQKKQRFIVDFTKYSKENMLTVSADATIGLRDNPDFSEAPVRFADFDRANNDMVAAAPRAVPTDIDGQRIFKPLREKVEGMLTKIATYAQSRIGDNPDRMEASGLPLSKEPGPNPDTINVPVERAKLLPGKNVGSILVSGKPNKAAVGLVIEERHGGTYQEISRIRGFKATLTNWSPDTVLVLQVRYWDNTGIGPAMIRPMAIVV